MKHAQPKPRLKKHCRIEITRDGNFAGHGYFIRHAGEDSRGVKQARIINERDMIEYIPQHQISAVEA